MEPLDLPVLQGQMVPSERLVLRVLTAQTVLMEP
jgi:hypothetical protein